VGQLEPINLHFRNRFTFSHLFSRPYDILPPRRRPIYVLLNFTCLVNSPSFFSFLRFPSPSSFPSPLPSPIRTTSYSSRSDTSSICLGWFRCRTPLPAAIPPVHLKCPSRRRRRSTRLALPPSRARPTCRRSVSVGFLVATRRYSAPASSSFAYVCELSDGRASVRR
jgi:hypothetical protein